MYEDLTLLQALHEAKQADCVRPNGLAGLFYKAYLCSPPAPSGTFEIHSVGIVAHD